MEKETNEKQSTTKCKRGCDILDFGACVRVCGKICILYAQIGRLAVISETLHIRTSLYHIQRPFIQMPFVFSKPQYGPPTGWTPWVQSQIEMALASLE